MFASEQSAATLFGYEPFHIPGLLQTEDYTRALMTRSGVPERTVDRMLEARSLRKRILDRPVPPELHFVIGEAALSLTVGSGEIMTRQLDQLRRLRQDFSLSVLPFSAGPHRSMDRPFLVLQFDDPELPDLLQYEPSASDDSSIDDNPELAADHLNRFIELQAASIGGDGFDAFVERIVATIHRL